MISKKQREETFGVINRIIGYLGLIYEVVVDKLRTPTALIIFGGLAGLPDVLGFRQSMRVQIEQEIDKQHQKDSEENKS